MAERYDHLVVGAGVIGAATAYHLSQLHPRARILLLERYPGPAQGNTAKSAAKVRDTVTSQVNLALCGSSIAAYRSYHEQTLARQARAGETEHGIGLNLCGYLWLMGDDGRKRNEAAMAMMRESGVDIEMIEREELARRLPQLNLDLAPDPSCPSGLTNITCGLLGKNCGSIEPDLLTKFYVDGFLSNGGQTRYDARVTALHFDASGPNDLPFLWQDTNQVHGVRIGPNNGTQGGIEDIFAETVTLAMNVHSRPFLEELGIPSHIFPKKRQLYELPTNLFEVVEGFNGHGLPFTIFPYGGIYVYKQSKGIITIGCADRIGRRIEFEEDPQPEPNYFIETVIPLLQIYLPGLAGRGTATAGMYDYSGDGVPNVWSPVKGLIVINGLSGRGIMTADAVGRIAAARTMGLERVLLHGDEEFKVDMLDVDPTKRNVPKEGFSI